DKLVALDEYPVGGKTRKMREATVLGVKRSVSQPYRITFEDGTSVVCSDNHRWLVDHPGGGGRIRWASIKVKHTGKGNPTPLSVGDHIRWIVDPWEEDESREAGYLAAMFDGEGWLPQSKTQTAYAIGMCQKPGVVFDTTLRYLKQLGFDPRVIRHNGNSTDVWQAKVTGMGDCLRLLGQVRPERFLERHHAMWEGRTPRGKVKVKRIVSIEPEGEPI